MLDKFCLPKFLGDKSSRSFFFDRVALFALFWFLIFARAVNGELFGYAHLLPTMNLRIFCVFLGGTCQCIRMREFICICIFMCLCVFVRIFIHICLCVCLCMGLNVYSCVIVGV